MKTFDIYYLPYKYEDRRKVSSICRLEANSFATIVGTVKSIETVKRFRLELLKSVISDDTGDVKAIWFNNLAIKKHSRKVKESFLPDQSRHVILVSA